MELFKTLTILLSPTETYGFRAGRLYGDMSVKRSDSSLKAQNYFTEYKIIDNELTAGITVLNSNDDYVTLGDPRGFAVSISTVNFISVCRQSTIINGVIREKCIWSKNVDNYLLVETSSEYKNSILKHESLKELKAEHVETGVSATKLNPGDIVTSADDKKLVFLGPAVISCNPRIKLCASGYLMRSRAKRILEEDGLNIVSETSVSEAFKSESSSYDLVIERPNDIITRKEQFLFIDKSVFDRINNSGKNELPVYSIQFISGGAYKVVDSIKNIEQYLNITGDYSSRFKDIKTSLSTLQSKIYAVMNKDKVNSNYFKLKTDPVYDIVWTSLKRKFKSALKNLESKK